MEKQIYQETEKKEPHEISEILDCIVKKWFFSRFTEYSESQLHGVIPIHKRQNILISAETGCTKTMTSFLPIVNYLIINARKNQLENKIYCIYTSPLKSLNNDIYENLVRPIEEIYKIAEKQKIPLQKIRVGLRTGDSSPREKKELLKNPPHIFITTPEGLAITLTTKKFIELYNCVEFAIIDEIHSLGNKRGVYLSISLERLSNISIIEPVRIGLSATVSPINEVANFLVGNNRDCLIAHVKNRKKTEIKVIPVVIDLKEGNRQEIQNSLYRILENEITNHESTLIFTNTRSATEKVVNNLIEMFPSKFSGINEEQEIDRQKTDRQYPNKGIIAAHHGSLSKEHRLDVEKKLRNNELKAVVCSSSLELGIDIGHIDLVILLGSPKSSSRVLQRIGRAGHNLYDISKGRFIVTDRDDLVECSILNKKAIEKRIDNIKFPKNCLDVLAQQIYGLAIQKNWHIDEILDLIRKSYCYSNLTKEDYMNVISYLSGEYRMEKLNVYPKIWYDNERKILGKIGKLARVIYMTNSGTIPDESFVSVVSINEKFKNKIGHLNEEFLEKIKPGDVFVLGGRKYQFVYSKGMIVYVKSAHKKNPNIPSWFSEIMPLSYECANEINRFRKLMNEKFEKKESRQKITEFIKEFCYSDESTATIIYKYFFEQFHYSKIPHESRIVVERFRAEKNYIVVHTLYGRKVNDAISRTLKFMMEIRSKSEIETGISDNGFYLAGEKLPFEEVLKQLNPENFKEILEQAIEKSETLKRRFRHCAARSLMILKNYKGRSKSVGKQQMRSFFLLAAVNKVSKNFPVLKEARREVMEDLMDIESAKIVLSKIKDNKVSIEKVENQLPSPFATALVLQGYSDLLKSEESLEFLKRMNHEINKEIRRTKGVSHT